MICLWIVGAVLSVCVMADNAKRMLLDQQGSACSFSHPYSDDYRCYFQETNHGRCLIACPSYHVFDPTSCSCRNTHQYVRFNSDACSTKNPFPGDERCYLSTNGDQPAVFSCNSFEIFDPTTCSCKSQNYNQAYTSDVCAQAAYSGSVPYNSPGSSTNEQSCQQNSAYNDLIDLMQGSPCKSMDSVWSNLYEIFGPTNHNSVTCGLLAITKLRDHYARLSDSVQCVCDSHLSYVNTNFWPSGQQFNCHSQGHPIYNELYESVFGPGHGNRECGGHYKDAFNIFHHTPCHCSVGVNIQATASPTSQAQTTPSHDSYSGCERYSEYRFFEDLMSRDNCMSIAEGWDKLKSLGGHSVDCRIFIINKLSEKYKNYGTPNYCTCDTNFDPLDSVYLSHGGHHSTCINEQHYKNFDDVMFHQHTCKTHHSIWSILLTVPHNLHHSYSFCQRDAINHAAASVEENRNPCTCRFTNSTTETTTNPVVMTTTTLPLSTSTLLHPTIFEPNGFVHDVFRCKNQDIEKAVTSGIHLTTNSLTCSGGGHAQTEIFASRNCNASDSLTWFKGYEVLGNCGRIPKYTLIGAFAANSYTHDGLVGILVGCTNSTITMATVDCNNNIGILTLDNQARDSYSHVADNFYTLSW